jgi:oligopeptide transport system substrate-binding protein
LLAIASCGSDQGSSPPDASLAVATISNRALTRALGGEPATLDPRLAEDNAALALLQDLYEGLTAEAADGNIIPGAAQSWSVSEDGRTWTFRLRENLRWSDGTPLTAAQFVAGLDAARVEGSQAPYSRAARGHIHPRN